MLKNTRSLLIEKSTRRKEEFLWIDEVFMSWDAISYNGKVDIHLFQSIMDIDDHIEILQNDLVSNSKK